MKRSALIILLFVIILNFSAFAENSINEIIDEELGILNIEDFDIIEFKNDILKKGTIPAPKEILEIIIDIIFKEALISIKTLLTLIIPILLMGILSNLAINDGGVCEMANIASYLAVSGIIIYVFSDVAKLSKETVDNINIASNCMIPVLYSIMLTMGKVMSYTVMHPTVIFLSRIIMLIVKNAIFPLVMLSFALNITDNITQHEKFKRISTLITKFTKWVLIFLITLFTAILSAQNILSHSFDSVALKGTKFIVANFVPVVGGAISDGAESIGSSLILIKNATGIAGIIGVLVIAFSPVIKIYLVSFMFFILSAISHAVSGERIAKVLDNSGSAISMLGAVVISISFLFIVSVAVLLGG